MSNKLKVDQQETRRLLLDIDENGTRLTKGQIDFVANLIDRKVKTFTEQEAARISKLHYKKVVNGKPDYDEL
jgi:hypothetical protein